ncbi:MAG TPA: serine hydrolase [Parafilimonas sp.]|nr:serine hydrolase [Parafilimonas sp.]
MRLLICSLLVFICTSGTSQRKTDSFLQEILSRSDDSVFQKVLRQRDTFRVQIIYTQIDRDKKNKPSFKNFYFNVDSLFYFNPASTVKLPLACLALEKLNKMHVAGVNKYTTMQFDSAYPHQEKLYADSTSEIGRPSIAQFIRKAFLVSDNDAYNRLYQFVGQQTINENLHAKGYRDVRITREFMGFTADENRHTNPIRFINKDGRLVYSQPMLYNTDSFDFSHVNKLGRAYYNNHDSLMNEPIDFSRVNNISLEDLQQILQSILFPESVPPKQRFDLTADDYKFLYQYLSQFPSETNYPKYDTADYYDSYVKFFFRNGSHRMPDGVRVFNKVGWAYGFLIDVSYVADFKNNIEFMLSAVVYVNSDGVLNDDKYDYDSVGWPFMYQLGQTIYQYELGRARKYKPDLGKFGIEYETRDVNDTRPAIKDVDN